MKRQKTSNGQKALTAVMGLYALVCLLPVLLVFIASISDDASLTQKGFSFFPTAFSTKGWDYVFNFGSQLLRSYEVTIFITVVGTALSLIVMSMYAYVLSKKEFMLRRFFTVLLIITMLFDGGQVSKYIIFSSVYKMKDTIWVLILPTCVSAMNVIIIRSYIQSNIPDSLAEAALIDGAGEFRCFWQVIFPMMKPSLAAVGFMRAVAIWNEWQNAYRIRAAQFLGVYAAGIRRVAAQSAAGELPYGHVVHGSRSDSDRLSLLPEVFRQGPYRRRGQGLSDTPLKGYGCSSL